MSALGDAAVSYSRRGWSVFPLRWTGSVEERKRPLVDSWDPYQQRAADEAQVARWWADWPQANIAVVTGAVSGLVVIDLDGEEAVQIIRNSKLQFPRTPTVHTGKGYHAYYAHPGRRVQNRARIMGNDESGVDVRGDGGYVVAPPSVHGSGRIYQWVIPPEEAIAPLPAGLLALIERKHVSQEQESRDADWVEKAMRGVPKGARNDTCARLAGYWLRVLGREDTLRVLLPWAERCDPSLTEREVRLVVESVGRIETTRREAEKAERLPRVTVYEALPWLEAIETAEPRAGQSLGVPGIDDAGGLTPGDLFVLAGRPGMGKSTLACQVTVEAGIRRKVPTLVVSAEMTRKQWGTWMAAWLAGCTTEQLTRPLRQDFRSQWLSSPIAVADPGRITVQEIRGLVESRPGTRLVVVDHIGKIGGGRRENRVLEVGDVARGLKSIAKDCDCTVLALCQLNRRVEGADDKEPRLDDLRESGEIEQEADQVLFLWTDERDRGSALLPMQFTLAKNRYGKLTKTRVTFDKPKRGFVA